MEQDYNDMMKRSFKFMAIIVRKNGEEFRLWSNNYEDLKFLCDGGVRVGMYQEYTIEYNNNYKSWAC